MVINEPFTSSSVTPAYDHAGNLIDDGQSQYVYDAWNRLVKVRSTGDTDALRSFASCSLPSGRLAGLSRASVLALPMAARSHSLRSSIQTAEFFADGRRARKDVSSSGVYDMAEVYLYDGQRIIETRDGSGNATKQLIHGTVPLTRHRERGSRPLGDGATVWHHAESRAGTDELLMVRVMNKGDFYVHQDANWNVVALTNLRGNGGGAVVERYVYTPYGEVNVMQATSFGDRDGDEDVDSTDKGTVGVTCTGTVTGECRILDLDFDGDYDSADATLFNSLPQGVGRHPGKFASGVDQPFHHQGLLFEPEVRQYQNRARQYDPGKKRFHSPDRLDYPDGLNRFLTARGNPIRFLDPRGLQVPEICDPFFQYDKGHPCNPEYPVPEYRPGPVSDVPRLPNCPHWVTVPSCVTCGACMCTAGGGPLVPGCVMACATCGWCSGTLGGNCVEDALSENN